MSAQSRRGWLLPMLAACWGAVANQALAADRPAVAVAVAADAPGYGCEEVDDRVAMPLAIALNGMPGVQRIRSRATAGRADVWVELGTETHVYKARQIAAERLQRAAAELPKAVVPRLAPVFVPDEIMLVALSATSNAPAKDALDATELRALADRVVRRRMLTMPGVEQVVVTGGLLRQCQAIVSPGKIMQCGLTISELVSAMERTLGEDAARPGSRETLVVGEARTLDDLAAIVLATREGNVVRLKDVAELRFSGVPPHGAAVLPKGEAKTPPQPVVLLGVLTRQGPEAKGLLSTLRQPESDAKQFSRALDQVIDELCAVLPAGVSLGRQLPKELVPLASQMAAEIQQDLPPEVRFRPEASADFGARLVRDSAPRTNIVIFGPDREHLVSVARDLADQLRKVPGVVNVQADSLEEARHTRIHVDRQKAARLGVQMSDIGATVELAIEGRKVGCLQEPRTGRAIDVVVTYGRDLRNDAESLAKLMLYTATQETVALGQLATVEMVSVPQSLLRLNMLRAVPISCELPASDRNEARTEIKRAIAASQAKLRAGQWLEWK